MTPTTKLSYFNPLETRPTATEVPLDEFEEHRGISHEVEAEYLLNLRNTGKIYVKRHALYDRIDFTPGQFIDGLAFFQTPVGMFAPGTLNVQTRQKTNMQRGGSLPAPDSFLIHRIFFLVPPESDHLEAAQFVDTRYAELRIGSKIMLERPLFTMIHQGSIFQLFDHRSPYSGSQDHPWPSDYPGNRLPDRIPIVNADFTAFPTSQGPENYNPAVADIKTPTGRFIPQTMHFTLDLMSGGLQHAVKKPFSVYAILDGVGSFYVQ